MIKDKAFYAAIEKASNSFSDRTSHRKFSCSSAQELESCLDAYLQTDMNYMRAGLILGLSAEMVSRRIRRLIEMGLKIDASQRGAPMRRQAEEMLRLYSDGYSYGQIAEFLNVDRSTVGSHLRGLRDLGSFCVDDDKRDRARLERCCAEHLADLHRHHSNRMRSIAA